jgi:Predicted GTPases
MQWRPNVANRPVTESGDVSCRERDAVVKDEPGITRDRVSYKAEWNDKEYTLVDTGGWEVDVRGLETSITRQFQLPLN